MSKVYIEKADVEYGEESYEKAKEFLKKVKFKVKDKKVLIKPNLVTDDSSQSGITADVSLCKAILERLENCKVVIGNDSDNFRNTGYDKLEKEYNCKIVSFDKLNKRDIVNVKVKNPQKFSEIPIARLVLDAEYVISLAKMKIHGLCQVTLSLKNMFGCVPTRKNRIKIHPSIRTALLDILQIRKPDFGFIDGIIGNQMDEVSSNPIKHGILLCSKDCLGLDIIGTRCMGINEDAIEFLRKAKGFYNYNSDKVEVKGERIEDVMKPYEIRQGLSTQLRYLGEKALAKVMDMFDKDNKN